MKENLKKSSGSLLGILYVFLSIISICFCYIISGNEIYSVGYNGFEVLLLKQLGVWAGFLVAFQILFFMVLSALAFMFLLTLLKNFKVVSFDIHYKKANIQSVTKFLMLVEVILSILIWFFTLFTILANADYALVFGAGTFLLVLVAIVGYVIYVLFFGKDIDRAIKEDDQIIDRQISFEDVNDETEEEQKDQTMLEE